MAVHELQQISGKCSTGELQNGSGTTEIGRPRVFNRAETEMSDMQRRIVVFQSHPNAEKLPELWISF